jgi:long-chain acyl-CoA synthetase
MESSDRLLSFMPLANAAERVLAVYQPINSGCLVYFGDSLTNLHDNIAAVQPTVIFSAPVLWERFAAAIKAKLGTKVKKKTKTE